MTGYRDTVEKKPGRFLIMPDRVGMPLYELRFRHLINESNFADMIGVSSTAVGHWETNTRRPRVDTAYMVLDVARELEPDAGHTIETLFPREAHDGTA